MKENLLLLAVAYPEISTKYNSTVCMAGILDTGEFRRIYPVSFDTYARYGFNKKGWVNYETRGKGDNRKESYKIYRNSIKKGEKVPDEEIIRVCKENVTTIEELREAYRVDKISLGIIKPELKNIFIQKRKEEKVEKAEKKQRRFNRGKKVDIIPYDIRFGFSCSENCHLHKSLCLDTEAGQLYRNVVAKYGEDSPEIIPKLRYRLFDWMKERELYFMMGSHSQHQLSFMVISMLYFNKEKLILSQDISVKKKPHIKKPKNKTIDDFF